MTARHAVVMCGGRGTRLGADAEKPLVEVGGVPMVLRVLRALAESSVDVVHAVVSPHTPQTEELLRTRAGDRGADDLTLRVRVGAGEGYVADLDAALQHVETPAVTVASDLPFLRSGHVDDALAAADGRSLAVCVPAALKRDRGVSADTTFDLDGREVAPTGLNVVGDDDADRVVVRPDPELAINVNRLADLDVARDRARE